LGEFDDLGRDGNLNRNIGMKLPKAPQARNEPIGCKCRERGDREDRLDHFLHAREGIPQRFESFRYSRSELSPLGCQGHLARQADEQRRPDPILQDLDLIAHGSLRHAEFLGSAGKALMPSRRLENPDGAHWGKFRRQFRHDDP
jgi:hypothetical protein